MKSQKFHSVPVIFGWLLDQVTSEPDRHFLKGDYEEIYSSIYVNNGGFFAFSWIIKQIISSTLLFFSDTVFWSLTMLKNYLKVAWRNIVRHKGYSFINFAGLAIGITCSVVIFLYVNDELSYDRFHKNSDRIYRICAGGKIGDTRIQQALTCAPLPAAMINDYPEVIQAVRIYEDESIKIEYGDKTFLESSGMWVDSTFFNLFSFKLLRGNPDIVLRGRNTIVLSRSTAKKYFGSEDPLNKTLILNDDTPYTVTGIMEDFPKNSHFHANFAASLSSNERITGMSWGNNPLRIYLLTEEGTNYKELEAKFPDFVTKYHGRGNSNWMGEGNYWEYTLQPLTWIHLNSNITGEFEVNGNAAYVYIFLIAAVFILLIACVNFMNLTTAKSMIRAKEIGIRKTIGSSRGLLIKQFLLESIVMSLIALLLSLIMIKLLLPLFNELVGKNLEINYFNNLLVLPSLLALSLVVGVLSGIYPAYVLSSYNPAAVLKSMKGKRRGVNLRNALVVFQFSISVFLFIGTMVVYNQLEYIQNMRLGFEKENVLVIENPSNGLSGNSQVFKESLTNLPKISAASYSNSIPGRYYSNWRLQPENHEDITINCYFCDYDILDTYRMEIAEGRFLSREFSSDSLGIVINETCAKMLNWEKPIGKKIRSGERYTFTVVGVVRDIYYESMRRNIAPMAFLLSSRSNFLSIRIEPGDETATLGFIKDKWDELSNGATLEYFFFDDGYNNLYKNEMYTGKVFIVFSFLSIFIASMGVFGLASFIAEQSTKEMGIRKALGATVSGLFALLLKDFVKLVLFANLLMWPAGYIVMNNWLNDFAYKSDIHWGIFIASGLLSLMIAVISVSYQAIKAARANPADCLRYE